MSEKYRLVDEYINKQEGFDTLVVFGVRASEMSKFINKHADSEYWSSGYTDIIEKAIELAYKEYIESEEKQLSYLEKLVKKMDKPTRTAYHYVYDRLKKIAPDLIINLEEAEYPTDVYGKSQYRTDDFGGDDAYMYLAIEGLDKDDKGRYIISMSHYYLQHGDMMCDPCMTVRLDTERKTAEALTFKMDGTIGRGIVKEVYGLTQQGAEGINVAQKIDQNSFLNKWTSNLINQGHKVTFKPIVTDVVEVEEEVIGQTFLDREYKLNTVTAKKKVGEETMYEVKVEGAPEWARNLETAQDLSDFFEDQERIKIDKEYKEKEEAARLESEQKYTDVSEALNEQYIYNNKYIDYSGLSDLQRGRLHKLLQKDYWNKERTATERLGKLIADGEFDDKETYTQEYSKKRIRLEYKKLANTKVEYMLKYKGSDDVYLDVPKMIYDRFIPPYTESTEEEIDESYDPEKGREYARIFDEEEETIEYVLHEKNSNIAVARADLKIRLMGAEGSSAEIDLTRNLNIQNYNPPMYEYAKLVADFIEKLYLANKGAKPEYLKGQLTNYENMAGSLQVAIRYDSKPATLTDVIKFTLHTYAPLKTTGSQDSLYRDLNNDPLEAGWYLIGGDDYKILTNGKLNILRSEKAERLRESGYGEEITELIALKEVPLSTQLSRLTGDSYNYIDFVNDSGKGLDAEHGNIIRHIKTGKRFKILFEEGKIYEAAKDEVVKNERPETDQLRDRKIINKLKEYRNKSKRDTFRVPIQKLIDRLEEDYQNEYEKKEDVAPVATKDFPIYVELSEGDLSEDVGYNNLEELETFLKGLGFTDTPNDTYIKNKVIFKGYTWPAWINLGFQKGDFNPTKESLLEYLYRNEGDFDWKQFSKYKDSEKPKEKPDSVDVEVLRKYLKDNFSFLFNLAKEKEEGVRSGYDINLFKSSFFNKLKTKKKNGEQGLVNDVLSFVKRIQGKLKKPIYTANHGIWKLADTVDEGDLKSRILAEPTFETEKLRREFNEKTDYLNDKLKSFPTNEMGLTPDDVKDDPAYRYYKNAFDKQFKFLQVFNKQNKREGLFDTRDHLVRKQIREILTQIVSEENKVSDFNKNIDKDAEAAVKRTEQKKVAASVVEDEIVTESMRLVDYTQYLGKGWIPALSVKAVKEGNIWFIQSKPSTHFNPLERSQDARRKKFKKAIELGYKVKDYKGGVYGTMYILTKGDEALTNVGFDTIESEVAPVVVEPTSGYFKAIDTQYKNAFELNKAIEEFLDSKSDDYIFSTQEKDFLYLYEGYGGLEKQGATGKGLLHEYYTTKQLIEKMWGSAYKFGFNTGKICEPSVGIGRFLDYTSPSDTVIGYEINPYSARICRIVHPNADIRLSSFAEHFYNGNVYNKNFEKDFDLVIGNPPYGENVDRRAAPEATRLKVPVGQYEHYFILRGLDLLKSGGLLVFVSTSNLFLGGYGRVKERIGEKADLVDGYLLNTSVFKTTNVSTSLIVLRKK